MRLSIINKVETGVITRWGFGGPWMRGKKQGQLALFMIWREEWFNGEVEFAYVLFTSRDWIKL